MEHFTKTLMRANDKIIPISRNLKVLNTLFPSYTQVKNLSNKSCMFTKVRRSLYLRLYPTVIVESDGSTYTVRHHEPRHMIKLPFDLSKVSSEEKAKILKKRKPKEQIKIEEEEKETYNPDGYIKLLQLSGKKLVR